MPLSIRNESQRSVLPEPDERGQPAAISHIVHENGGLSGLLIAGGETSGGKSCGSG